MVCFKTYSSEKFQAAVDLSKQIKCKVHLLLLLISARRCEDQMTVVLVARLWHDRDPSSPPVTHLCPFCKGPDPAPAFCMLWQWHFGTGTPLWFTNCASQKGVPVSKGDQWKLNLYIFCALACTTIVKYS